MQRNFELMRKQVETWQRSELTDVTAKVVIDEAFVEDKLEAPKHLARAVHDLYFEPKYEEFRPRTIWSLSNAFTSAFKELDPIPQFQGDGEAGRVPGGSVLEGFLTTHGGAGRTSDPYTPFLPGRRREGGDFARPTDFPEIRLWSVSRLPTTQELDVS